MTQDIDGLLLEGEAVIWRGAPDFTRANGKPTPLWRRRLYMFLLSLVFIAGTAGVVMFGSARGMDGFLGIFLGLLALLLGLIAFILLIKIFDQGPSADPTGDTRYLLTNLRLVSIFGATDHYSLLTRHITGIRVTAEGEACDLRIWTILDAAPALTLHAIPDGPAVERLIPQTLSHPKPDAPQ